MAGTATPLLHKDSKVVLVVQSDHADAEGTHLNLRRQGRHGKGSCSESYHMPRAKHAASLPMHLPNRIRSSAHLHLQQQFHRLLCS